MKQEPKATIYLVKGESRKPGAAKAKLSFPKSTPATKWTRHLELLERSGFQVVTRKQYYAFKFSDYSNIQGVEVHEQDK